jgi:hypothetical protein
MPKLINVGGEPLLKEKSWCVIQETKEQNKLYSKRQTKRLQWLTKN